VDTCLELGIRRLVYTSTLDVVVEGSRPIVDGDESLPYPKRVPRDPYCRTKILAERLVLDANGSDLATCALRPVGMYGPRDRYHLGNVISMARRGRFVRLGDGSARFSHVYSENAAFAHLLAARRLEPGSPIAGQAYFIADHYPAGNLFDFMEPFLMALGLPLPRRSIPYPVAMALATIAELVAPRSNFSRFAVIQTCVDHTFVDGKAARELGYWPIVSKEEAFRRTVAWLRRREAISEGERSGLAARRR
jgi:nucleoside-diphosphate-sugar epimerase